MISLSCRSSSRNLGVSSSYFHFRSLVNYFVGSHSTFQIFISQPNSNSFKSLYKKKNGHFTREIKQTKIALDKSSFLDCSCHNFYWWLHANILFILLILLPFTIWFSLDIIGSVQFWSLQHSSAFQLFSISLSSLSNFLSHTTWTFPISLNQKLLMITCKHIKFVTRLLDLIAASYLIRYYLPQLIQNPLQALTTFWSSITLLHFLTFVCIIQLFVEVIIPHGLDTPNIS